MAHDFTLRRIAVLVDSNVPAFTKSLAVPAYGGPASCEEVGG